MPLRKKVVLFQASLKEVTGVGEYRHVDYIFSRKFWVRGKKTFIKKFLKLYILTRSNQKLKRRMVAQCRLFAILRKKRAKT